MSLPAILAPANRPALAKAARKPGPYLCLLIVAALVAGGVMTGSLLSWVVAAIYAALAYLLFDRNVTDAIEDRENDRKWEKDEAMRAEFLGRFENGVRCPDDCTGCQTEDARRDAEVRAFLAERAARHGHAPTATN